MNGYLREQHKRKMAQAREFVREVTDPEGELWVWCFTHNEAHRFSDPRLDDDQTCLALDVDAGSPIEARDKARAARVRQASKVTKGAQGDARFH